DPKEAPVLHAALWIILAIWVGIAFLILFAIVATIGVSTARLLLDKRGVAGTVWCPVLRRTLKVLGPPAAFVGTVSGFEDIRRCERFGDERIECHKWCIKADEFAEAAKSN
ncbi:MAG: hypothetical protein B7Z72_14140, partial [Gemmatimonadetes bacterium 21-71-4]